MFIGVRIRYPVSSVLPVGIETPTNGVELVRLGESWKADQVPMPLVSPQPLVFVVNSPRTVVPMPPM